MKYLALLISALAVAQATPVQRPLGIDVISDYQPDIDWTTVVDKGIPFAYIKATEGTSDISLSFSDQYAGVTNAGLIHGSYHFAHPNESSGARQAEFFLKHGGKSVRHVVFLPNVLLAGWRSLYGITLPGALAIENNPDGDECYDLTASEMVSWIEDFSNTYMAATRRYPVIYTTTDWWTACTGDSTAFANKNPLWVADHSSTLSTPPAG